MEGQRHRPPPYPVQPGSQQNPPMEGFGSADITSPFHYGSVEDGRYRQDSLEQKLRKQYWKTKQTVIEKLGKSQDEFVVAGDADIDMKLEKAFHLQSSCDELLRALEKYISRIRAASLNERVMGEHLRTWSETEYTNAGEVMQNVGKTQEEDAKRRLQIETSLQRMRSEFMVFRVTAIRDLGLSIQRLQKARTEYRAALLWMKDVSEKLQNPDYRNQLFKFREAQVAVKESKHRFEKLKFDLGEKIDMVSASRCNLLSRSLPNYQKEMLAFYDQAANDFHKILVDLRSHHHHQYKVRRLAEEIRDLEAEESPFSDDLGLLGPLGGQNDDVPLLDVGSGAKGNSINEGGAAASGRKEGPPKRLLGSDQFSIEKIQEEAKVKDLALSGIEAELRELQKEVLQPSSGQRPLSSPKPAQSEQQSQQPNDGGTPTSAEKDKEDLNEFRDLLQLDEEEGTADEAVSKASQPPQDKLFDDWSSFSAFMSSTDPEERTPSPTSGWEKELMSPTSDNNSLLGLESHEGGVLVPQTTPTASDEQKNEANHTDDVPVAPSSAAQGNKVVKGANDKTASYGDGKTATTSTAATEPSSSGSSDLLSEDLKALGISPDTTTPVAPPKPALGGDMGSLDPSYFNQQLQPVPMMTSMTGVPQFPAAPPPGPSSSSSTMMMMPMAPPTIPGQQLQQPQMFRSPQSNSQRPILAAALASSPAGFPSPLGGTNKIPPGAMGSPLKANGRHVSDGDDKEKEKAASWMNVFAHLDPLVNEKV